MRRTTAIRFWSKVNKKGPILREELGPCWVWTACRNAHGYGRITVGRDVADSLRVELAHRLAFFLAHGRWPAAHCLHKCDGGSIGCVRAEHLYEGTHAQNMADMWGRGRARPGKSVGIDHGCAKLTEEQVLEIRKMLSAGDAIQRVIGERFGISQVMVSRIKRGKAWAHL